MELPRLKLNIDEALKIAGSKFEYKELARTQIKVFKEISKPFDRELRRRYKSQFRSYGSPRKIARPPLYLKGIEQAKLAGGLPALLLMPKNNGAIWFEMGTQGRKTRKGYNRGRIDEKEWGQFRSAFNQVKSVIGRDMEEQLTKVLNRAINNSLKKNIKVINGGK